MRFRLVEPRDFPTCRALLNPALRLSHRVVDRLPTLWRALALFGTFSIVEDPIKPHPDSIQGFGASAFVSDQFVDEFLAARRSYLDAALYERMIDGPSPVLSEGQVAEANAGDGLNLVVLNYGLRDHDLSNPSTQRVLQLGTTAFYTLHAGCRIKAILNEVFSDEAAKYMKAGGTWRRIYDRVSRRLPYLIADERKAGGVGRSTEKRRHVLEHVRAHPEEVRPIRRA